MQRRQYLAGLGLALAVPAAGCSAPADSTPTPGGQRLTVSFSNESDRTLVFTAAVVEAGLGGVRIIYRDDSERTFPDADTVDDVPADAWNGAVTFEPLGPHQRRQFRSTAGSGLGVEFEPVPFGSTVVTTVAAPNTEQSIRSVGAGTCGEAAAAEVSVQVDAEGRVHLHTTCKSET